MYEELIFKLGFFIGYFAVLFISMFIVIIYYTILERKWNKYLRTTKQHQKYEEFMYNNRVNFKLVRK